MTAKSGFLPWLAVCVLFSGCISFNREQPRPGQTSIGKPIVILPAQMIDNYLILEVKWDKYGPYHFIIDTGSTTTLVTPELAQRYAVKNALLPEMPQVSTKSADGGTAVLPPTMLNRIDLGEAHFSNVPALVYDCAPLTAQLGVKIDGILGFPLFRETLLTLDYPHERVELQPFNAATIPDGTAVAFNNANKVPLVPVRLGDRTLIALIDSGLDEGFVLNPIGLDPKYIFAPTLGPTATTLTGDHTEMIGRLADTLYLGDYAVPHPVVEVIDELYKVGGGILKYFTVTFDQEHDRVFFLREATDPIAVPALRSTGLSFTKDPAYWRVAGVIPGSPASLAGIEPGDLVTAINGEPVAKWGTRRYEQLMANAEDIRFTFLNGASRTDHQLNVVELVP